MASIENERTATEFFLSTDATWAAMYESCENARTSIEFEQYIIMNDELGLKFIELFTQKAKEGLSVRLILDKFGSRSLIKTEHLKNFVESGGQLLFYNPISWWNIFFPFTWFPRNHTKMMLIDSELAYVGGVCLSYAMTGWRDTQMRFTGPVITDVKKEFDNTWNRLTKRSKFKALPEPDKDLSYVVSSPTLNVNPIYRNILQGIRYAKNNIYIACPFFFPPERLRKSLKAAARRGVDVKIMVSGKTDVPFASNISHSYFPGLIEAGVSILLYNKTVLHAKYLVIDDDWATVGSTNLDYLSLIQNREANIIARDEEVVKELKRHFRTDMLECDTVGDEHWSAKNYIDKFSGYFGRAFEKFL